MKAIFRNDYPAQSKKTGEWFTMFVYRITKSTEEEMNAYKRYLTGKGYEPREDEGCIIFQTPNYSGEQITIGISPTSGIPYVDNSAMNKARSIARQYGALNEFKSAIANNIAQTITGDILGGRTSSVSNATATTKVEKVEETEEEDAM